MKNMRRILSLVLVLMMVLSLSVTAFAASPADATVTVYITEGKFTEGGIDNEGNQIPQAYIGGTTPNYTKKVVIDVGDITSAELSQYRSSYSAPTNMSATVNVLDAIACALDKSGYTYTGGWDTFNTPNGGYISSVSGFTSVFNSEEVEVNGTFYTKYTGSGWNIAFDQGNGYVVPEYYGTSYTVVNGMSIVFDFSPYALYYEA